MREPRLDKPPLALVADVLLDGGAELRTGGRGVLLFEDPGAGTDHLRQRPVRDALAVGQATALMPAHDPLDPIDVLEELPQSLDLPEPASPTTVTIRARALALGRLEGVDDQRQLAIAPNERRLQPDTATGAAGARDDPERGPCMHRLLSALDLMGPRVLVGDRRLRSAAGHIVDQDGPRLPRSTAGGWRY